MDDVLNRLLDKAWSRFLETPSDTRFLIAIAGIPGSGKTTLSKRLTTALNARHAASAQPPTTTTTTTNPPAIAAFVPMDGYHLSRAQLDALPDPATAHSRRGAEFTFDGPGFVQLVRRLKEPLTAGSTSTATVFAPSFDHATKDPKADDIAIEPTHRIVVLEGNYLLLPHPPWSDAHPLFSLTVFVSVPLPLARTRLAARHVAAGLTPTLAEGDRRAVENDLPNGAEVTRLLRREDVDEMVESKEDGEWALEE